jgi:hypothetical protein
MVGERWQGASSFLSVLKRSAPARRSGGAGAGVAGGLPSVQHKSVTVVAAAAGAEPAPRCVRTPRRCALRCRGTATDLRAVSRAAHVAS